MEITPNYANKFHCNICDFKCSKNIDWTRHVLTRKHINRTNINNIEQKIRRSLPNMILYVGNVIKNIKQELVYGIILRSAMVQVQYHYQ